MGGDYVEIIRKFTSEKSPSNHADARRLYPRYSAKSAGEKIKMKRHYFIFFVILLLILLPEISEAQCAMCKASVESSQGQKNSVAGGINQGILYLMAVPYLLLGFIFRKQLITLWKVIRKKPVAEEDL